MVGVDSELGSSVLRLWIAAGSAAVLVAICAVAFQWATDERGAGRRRRARRDRRRRDDVGAARQPSRTRSWCRPPGARTARPGTHRRTLAPGSALACLDALAGENVDAACEKAIFASAATVATATSYAAARFELLSDMVAYIKRGGRDIDGALVPLRHSLETDPYGFLAHALAVRDGCTSQNCKALDVLADASHVRANLSGQTLDRYLDHYLTAWALQPDGPGPVADAATQGQPTPTTSRARRASTRWSISTSPPRHRSRR